MKIFLSPIILGLFTFLFFLIVLSFIFILPSVSANLAPQFSGNTFKTVLFLIPVAYVGQSLLIKRFSGKEKSMKYLKRLHFVLFGCLILSAVLSTLTYTPLLASATFRIVIRFIPVVFATLNLLFTMSFGPLLFLKEKDEE